MSLSLADVQRDTIANRALNQLLDDYSVAEEKSRLVLTKKSGDLKLFVYELDDLHQLDFIYNQQMVRDIEQLRVLSTTYLRGAARELESPRLDGRSAATRSYCQWSLSESR